MHYHPERKPLDRRTFLKGSLGGATITLGLPLLETMTDTQGRVYAGEQSGEIPTRYLFTFAGSSTGASGASDDDFVPPSQGPLAGNVPAALSPIEKIADQTTLVSGLEIPWASEDGETPPPGGRVPDFHGGALGPLLTGVRSKGNNGSMWVRGKSSDQVVAEAFGVDPLIVRVQASKYIAGSGDGFLTKSISWGDGGDKPIAPLVDPHRVFEQLFGANSGWTPPDSSREERSRRARKLSERRSILDAVKSSYEQLKKQRSLSHNDRQRVQQHFDEIRDLERKLGELADEQQRFGQACKMPDEPDTDWPVAGGNPAENRQANFETSRSWSNEDLRGEALSDLVYFALVCNRTRVVALQYTMAQSFMSAEYLTRSNAKADVHELGHGRGRPEDVVDIHNWHLEFYADLVDRLSKAREADGSSVLDHTAALYVPEGGHGFDPTSGQDNSPHSTENMAVLVSGKSDTLVNGMHIRAPKGARHPANVFISAMEAVGAPNGRRFGEVEGVVPQLMKG